MTIFFFFFCNFFVEGVLSLYIYIYKLILQKVNCKKYLFYLGSTKIVMDKSFIYFGIEICTDRNVYFLTSNTENISCTQCFSYLQLPPKLSVDDVYLGWMNLIFKTDVAFFHIKHCLDEWKGHATEVFSSLNHVDIKEVVLGLTYSFVVTKDGRYHFFSNKNFLSDYSSGICKIENIVTEDLYSIVLTEGGKVFIFEFDERPHLEELVLPVPIKEIACGKEHVLLLSDFGTIYSFGSGSRGQLGHGSIENQKTPAVVEALEGLKIKTISAGGWHSTAISDSGDLYMWGWNESGQLGFPCNELQNGKRPTEEIETICCLPKNVELNDETVKAVSCGSRHTVALTENKNVWTWGWNGYGQLGHTNALLSDKPEKIQLLDSFEPLRIKAKFWSTLVIGYMNNKKDLCL